jgi:hypothetical protein
VASPATSARGRAWSPPMAQISLPRQWRCSRLSCPTVNTWCLHRRVSVLPVSTLPIMAQSIAKALHISQPGFFNENQWMANGDYLLSDRNKIALRYFGALSNVSGPLYTRLKEIHSFSPSASMWHRSETRTP